MNTTKTFFKMLRNAEIFTPENIGINDILIAGQTIAAIGANLPPLADYECETIDLTNYLLFPGLIDSHVHLIGGGGEGGFATRTPEIRLSDITKSAVTTVVGCLGTDGTTRHIESLLAKARALDIEGISAYIYTGSYEIPTPTITGSIRRDIINIDKIIGTGEIALSDHRSSQPSLAEYRKLIAATRLGGMLSGKAGIVDMHLGDGANGLAALFEITKSCELPKTQILPTHINRNKKLFAQSLEWAKQGGYIDITSGISPATGCTDGVKPSTAAKQALTAGVPLEQIMMSSDSNGSMPLFDNKGNTIGIAVAKQTTLLEEIRDLIKIEGIPCEQAIQLVTGNIAKALKLWPQKGCIQLYADADIIALNKDFILEHLWAKGCHMIKNGNNIVTGTFDI